MRWSFFFLAEYASMFFVSAVGSLLFLGGWWTGIAPIDSALHSILDGYPGRVLGMVVLLSKAGFLVVVQIWIRWTLPRLRIDQVMTTCLKYLVPISCFLFVGSVIWPLLWLSVAGRPTMLPVESIGNRVQQVPVISAPLPLIRILMTTITIMGTAPVSIPMRPPATRGRCSRLRAIRT